MISTAYLLDTDRLFFREFEISDGSNFYRLNADPEVMKFTGDMPFKNVQEAENFLRSYPNYERDGYGRWTVVLKETGEVIGWCGLKYHPEENFVDLGYRFHKRFWGQGFATEAARACIIKGFNDFGLQEIIGRTAKDNIPSIHVLENIGMKFWKDAPCEGIENSVYYKINRNG